VGYLYYFSLVNFFGNINKNFINNSQKKYQALFLIKNIIINKLFQTKN